MSAPRVGDTAVLEEKGDLLSLLSNKEAERLPVGAASEFLTADPSEPLGLRWTPLGNDGVTADWYSAVTTAIGIAATTLTLDTERQGNPAFTLAANEVTVNIAGKYRIDYDAALLGEATNYDVEFWLELNGVEVPGTRSTVLSDATVVGGATGHAMCILSLVPTDVLRVRGISSAASATTRADGVRLLIQTAAASPTDYILPFGANFNGPGAQGRYMRVNGDATGSNAISLDPTSEISVLKDGTITVIGWNSDNADATTVLKILVNGLVVASVTLSGAQGSDASLSIPVVRDDVVAIEYDSGTDPKNSTADLLVSS